MYKSKETKNRLILLITLVIIYFIIKYIIPFGEFIIYPITLIVTFLHEFGHGLGSLITGGSVESIQINPDGSGFAATRGGLLTIVLMGGYIGSAIFGNLLLYIGLKKEKYIKATMYGLMGLMICTAIIWFNSIISSLILLIIAGLFYLILTKTDKSTIVLQFLGIATILYILEDFNVGPSSDLAKFSEIYVIIPQNYWMYIWLLLVILITYWNIKRILKK